MEQSCAEITLDTICSLAGINQCACVMFVTLNPADMKILHCSRLPTSAVQANRAQKRQMSITGDKEKNQRHKKVRAHQSLGDRRSLAHFGQLWPQCPPGDRTTRNGWTFASIQSFHPSPVTPDHTGAADPTGSSEKTQPKPIQVLGREVPVQPARRTNPDP